jgi:hypothetical protein
MASLAGMLQARGAVLTGSEENVYPPMSTMIESLGITVRQGYHALRLAGWRLWYKPRLRMQHFLPESRLQWDYLRQVSRGFGAATAGIDAYEMAIKNGPLVRSGTRAEHGVGKPRRRSSTYYENRSNYYARHSLPWKETPACFKSKTFGGDCLSC